MKYIVEWFDIKKIPAPKDRKILVCTRGMAAPWSVQWREGKRKQGFESMFAFIHFEPEFWAEVVKCPQ